LILPPPTFNKAPEEEEEKEEELSEDLKEKVQSNSDFEKVF
jgi:hypothetical protein